MGIHRVPGRSASPRRVDQPLRLVERLVETHGPRVATCIVNAAAPAGGFMKCSLSPAGFDPGVHRSAPYCGVREKPRTG
jgi:hypothetical protein